MTPQEQTLAGATLRALCDVSRWTKLGCSVVIKPPSADSPCSQAGPRHRGFHSEATASNLAVTCLHLHRPGVGSPEPQLHPPSQHHGPYDEVGPR